MNYEQLKNSILQEAIEGRLVPQNPNDEPASVLLDRIRDEKAKLVKEKKIKKDKNESRIYRTEDGHWMERFTDKKRPDVCIDDEIPFDIPNNWEFCRLSYILQLIDGEKKEGKNVVLDAKYLRGKGAANYLQKGKLVKQGDDIILVDGENSGEVFSVPIDGYMGSTFKQLWVTKIIDKNYVLYNLLVYKGFLRRNKKGAAIPHLNKEIFYNILIGIPPLKEQHRIVEKLEQILPKVEEYGKAQERLDTLNAELPEKLKTSILQEAIEGRLVPQDPNDEPASILLDRIRDEKAKLVKEKKIKKDKNESRIYRSSDGHWMEHFTDKKRPEVCIDDEIPFDIPNNWEFCRLSYILQLIDGEKKEGKNVVLDAKYLRGKGAANYLQKGKLVKQGDDIILVDGENSGEVFSVPIDGYMGSTFKQLWVTKIIDKNYVLYNLLVYKGFLRRNKKGAAIPHLNKEIFYNILIGIPPLKEQHRIVEKLDSILPMLDTFKKR